MKIIYLTLKIHNTFIEKDLSIKVLSRAKQVPVLAIIGHRQSGKKFFVPKNFSNHSFVDLQDADTIEFAQNDKKSFLAAYQNNHDTMIDELNMAPTFS